MTRRQQPLWQQLQLSESAVQLLDAAETARLRQAWVAAYGRHGQGVGMEQFLWHVFSADLFPSVEGEEAERAYGEYVLPRYLVLPNDPSVMAFYASQRPQAGEAWNGDCYVCPPNLAWTMAFTHEVGWIGPFFAKHPRYAQLQVENLNALRKQQEKAKARDQGWLCE